ncbi:hypothetical protein ABWL48_16505, partial [Streptococcus suis]
DDIENIKMFPAVITQKEILIGDRIGDSKIFSFLVPLKNNNVKGMYCVPLKVTFKSGLEKIEPIIIGLSSNNLLPSSFKLNHLYRNI